MKVVILAGGLGTRLSEETAARPKPMVEIGGKPILWHIMKMYLFHGIYDFIIDCGDKGYSPKEQVHYKTLTAVEKDLEISQRELTLQLGASNGKGHYWMATLEEKVCSKWTILLGPMTNWARLSTQ